MNKSARGGSLAGRLNNAGGDGRATIATQGAT